MEYSSSTDSVPADEEPPEIRLSRILTDREETLAVAESLTGGLIGSRITDVPGSSAYFDRGFVTYAYDAKRRELGVPREMLDAHGAVSAPVARAMAAGARDRADTTWAVSATGVAGPGGTPEKPAGLVYVGVAYAAPWGTGQSFVRSDRGELDGSRDAVKSGSVDLALGALIEAIQSIESRSDSASSIAVDADVDGDGDGDVDGDGDGDGDVDGDGNEDGDVDGDGNEDGNEDGDGDVDTDTDTAPDQSR